MIFHTNNENIQRAIGKTSLFHYRKVIKDFIFIQFQDEKNQVLVTNVWLDQVSMLICFSEKSIYLWTQLWVWDEKGTKVNNVTIDIELMFIIKFISGI